MSPNRGPCDAFEAERQRLMLMGVTAESARTALTLILTFVLQYQSQQGWSAAEAVRRFRKIVGAIWSVYPVPEVWESISNHRFETGGRATASKRPCSGRSNRESPTKPISIRS